MMSFTVVAISHSCCPNYHTHTRYLITSYSVVVSPVSHWWFLFKRGDGGVGLRWQYPYLRSYDMWRWRTVFGNSALCVFVSVWVTVCAEQMAVELCNACLVHTVASWTQPVAMEIESRQNTHARTHVIRRSGYEWSLPFWAREFPFLAVCVSVSVCVCVFFQAVLTCQEVNNFVASGCS